MDLGDSSALMQLSAPLRMLSRRPFRPFLTLIVLTAILALLVYRWPSVSLPSPSAGGASGPQKQPSAAQPPKHLGHPHAGYTEGVYREVFSVSTTDRKYFKIDFSPRRGINPNAVPHPTLKDHWYIVGQLDDHPQESSVWFAELVCIATMKRGVLSCVDNPMVLTVGKTPGGGNCTDDIAYFNFAVGPHDARITYGPTGPLVIFGALSQYTCLGLWIQDFRVLTDWPFELFDPELFRDPTEIQRPGGKYSIFEKNYFVFWDKDGTIYAHYDISPNRAFAQLSKDGSVGPDLAPDANDDACMARHMPKLEPTEHVHQATNSISITLCKRADATCKPDDSNTFILTIFQVKKGYDGHAVYEPYVMLFQQQAPFAVHGISSKPIWISGRGKPGEWKTPEQKTMDQTQMFYVTSVSWKQAGSGYHGYIDDVIFVLFGIEDNDAGGIDVIASDLLADMGLCATP